jgi:hypothetical protein
MFKKLDIFWSIYLAHRCFKFDVSIDDIIDVSKILRIPYIVSKNQVTFDSVKCHRQKIILFYN